MADDVHYSIFTGEEVTGEMLTEAANLFSANYGFWGPESGRSGQRVRFGAKRIREQCLPDQTRTGYVRVLVNNVLAGNVFACRWKQHGKTVCWITQLVVSKDYRRRGLATGLLNMLRHDSDDIYGVMSSHPAACLAAANAFSATGIRKLPLAFIRENASSVISASPISYIRDAKLCGSVFDPDDASGLVSGVDTAFFVDHEEPVKVLTAVRQNGMWPLGDLLEGHEYLLIISGDKIQHDNSP